MTNPVTTAAIDLIDQDFPKMRESGRSLGRILSNLFEQIIAMRGLFVEESRLAHDEGSTSGLNLGLFGTKAHSLGGAIVDEPDQVIALTDNALNYVEYDPSTGTISANTTGFTANRLPLHKATAKDGAIDPVAVLDQRPLFAILRDSVAAGTHLVDAVADAMPYFDIAVGAEAANAITLTIQAKDAGGENLASYVHFELWLSDAVDGWETADPPDGGIAVGVGTLRDTPTAATRINVTTNSSGQAQVTLTESAVETWYARVLQGDGRVATSGAITFA